MTMSVVTSVSTVGSKKGAAERRPLAAGHHLGTLLDRVDGVGLHLLHRLHVNQRPITAPTSNPSATFIAPTGLCNGIFVADSERA